MTDHIVILGAASAVAEHYARLQAGRGARLLLAGRNETRLQAIAADLRVRGAAAAEVMAMDLAAPAETIAAAWGEFVERLDGRIDLVLLAYGVLGDQAKAAADPVEASRILNVNLLSACAWLTAAAETLDRQGRGALIAIGSVAGDRARRNNYVYGAAKGGLALFSQGLAHRFAGTKVQVLTVKPGFIDTPMTANMAKGGPLWATPDKVAADIDAAQRKGRVVLYTPWFWWGIMAIIRSLPWAIFKKMKI